jgi:hypothetical protein
VDGLVLSERESSQCYPDAEEKGQLGPKSLGSGEQMRGPRIPAMLAYGRHATGYSVS